MSTPHEQGRQGPERVRQSTPAPFDVPTAAPGPGDLPEFRPAPERPAPGELGPAAGLGPAPAPALDTDPATVPGPPSGGRGRRRLLIAGGVLAALVCLPAGWFASGLVGDTVEAGKGGETPGVAVSGFMHEAFAQGLFFRPGGVDRWVCHSKRAAVNSQVAATRAELDAVRETWPALGPSRWESEGAGPGDQVAGDKATRSEDFRMAWNFADTGGSGSTLFYQGEAHTWTFNLVKESGTGNAGWKVCGYAAPPLCTYVHCVDGKPAQHPPATPTPSAGVTPPPATSTPGAGPAPSPTLNCPDGFSVEYCRKWFPQPTPN